MSVHVVIAARGGPDAKSRCGRNLTSAQRGELVEAMLADMLAAMAGSALIDEICVVTPTAELGEIARLAGASVLREARPRGLNAAFTAARRAVVAADPAALFAALPGDLPLFERDEFDAVLAQAGEARAVLVPATADGGTGAVIVPAGAPFAFSFGADSFLAHRAAAVAAGLEPVIVEAASLGRDIDSPADLDDLLQRAQDRRSGRLLRRFQHLREAAL